MGVSVATLGYPRIGPHRELKYALEAYWSGKSTYQSLQTCAATLRRKAWETQREAGADILPSNDFSLYDHVLDLSAMVGLVPAEPEGYFAHARGSTGCCAGEMTKWFDTNYHYIVPEFEERQAFIFASTKILDDFLEAKDAGFTTRPVLLGPISFLLLGKMRHACDASPLSLLPRLLPIYRECLLRLAEAGVEWVQIDEPILVGDLSVTAKEAFHQAYAALRIPDLALMLTTYFGEIGENLETVMSLPIQGVHLDLVRAPDQIADVVALGRQDLVLSLGVIDGRNVWRSDLSAILDRIEPVVALYDTVIVAPSCSLLHVPLDLSRETELDSEVKPWLSFAIQKIEELAVLAKALNEGRAGVSDALAESDRVVQSRRSSARVRDPAVQERLRSLTPAMARRASALETRRDLQQRHLKLPLFPTTTIGSFPQTSAIRKMRADHARGLVSDQTYTCFLQEETKKAVEWQQQIGLDVLVHGEFERNDMVQYFGERLSGFVFTKHAWVQSYGSRYVRPPILFGDVSRPEPMTLSWWIFAQSCTSSPMKAMLTGPVTILNWSFVRDDQSRETTCRQIALAIRDEVQDLDRVGARVIQIDEAALREGLPLRRKEWAAYLEWAIASFRLASSGVQETTQIHTHMCYSEFNDILGSIAAMDADVISIETARSKMALLDAFVDDAYPAAIGPGVYDIHTQRIPTCEEIETLLEAARARLSDTQIWVNPDCGLKTRRWAEVKPAIAHMVETAKRLRTRCF